MNAIVPGHIISTETEARASKTGFYIEQQTLRLTDVNTVKFEHKLVKREPLPNLRGSKEKCLELIHTLQKRHAMFGFNAELNTWWAHDMPEGGAVPETIYRWILV
jgi:hypothetical protein